MLVLCVVGFVLGQVQTVARNRGHLDVVSRTIQTIESPAAGTIHSFIGFSSDFWIGVRQATSLKKETERLRAVERAAQQYQETIDRYKSRIDQLDRMLAYEPPPPRTKVVARIIGYFPQQNRATLDRGAQSGIEPHMAVCAAEGLVGIVETVSKTSCQVLLLTSPQIRVAAKVSSQAPIPGIVRGETATRLVFDSLEAGQVYTGETVITSGFSESIPEGIMVGTIVELFDDPQAGTKRIFLLPSVRMGSVDEVYVLK